MTAQSESTAAHVALATGSDRPLVNEQKMRGVSRAELERRWGLLREHMRSCDVQALVVQGYEEKIGGNVRWLTGVPPGYPRSVVFHLDDLMTLIDHGPQGEVRQLADRDPNRPGVGELVTNWALFCGQFTSGLAAECAARVIRQRGYTRVGLVGERSMPHGFVADLRQSLGGVRFCDETDFFDGAKARKSDEELALIEATAETQDRVFTQLLAWLEPGVRDFEVNAFADYQLQLLGAERGVYIGTSAPIGTPATFGYRPFQGRTMYAGDHINILLESNGSGGQWTELGRLVSFGKVDSETRDAHAVCVEAQAQSARLSVAGARPADIFAAHNAFMVRHGSEPERRLHSHGEGYDAVERPLIRSDETMALPGRINLAIHPTYSRGATFATLCDNYIVAADGPGRFLHRTPKEIFEL